MLENLLILFGTLGATLVLICFTAGAYWLYYAFRNWLNWRKINRQSKF